MSSRWEHVPLRAGIYIIRKGQEVIYVGKSNILRLRIRTHPLRNRILSGLYTLECIPMRWARIATREISLIRKLRPRLNMGNVAAQIQIAPKDTL